MERNRVVHGSTAKPAPTIASFVVNYLSNFRTAKGKKYHTAATNNATQPALAAANATWKPPTGTDLKLNVDAALDANWNIIGVGAVVRDATGHVLAALAKPIIGNFASHEMEAKAMFHSLNWIIQLQLPIAIVQTDALVVANALQNGSTAITSYHDLLLDVSSLLFFFPQIELYFTGIFSSQGVDQLALQAVLDTISVTITPDSREALSSPFTANEVYAALKSMSEDSSPGIDGMSVMFYTNYWHIVGSLVTSSVLDVLNHGGVPSSFNRTLITLIPKVKKPSRITQYRPINNILVAFEVLHSLKIRKRGSQGYATMKLDMSKAFDRVEWHFLEQVMLTMGFGFSMVELILRCLRSFSYSFLLNGSVQGSVTPHRGIRQGDPLSPYLFLICSEGFSRLLQFEESTGALQGPKVSRSAPPITHLLFADDSVLFGRASRSSARAIHRCLDLYSRASGQMLNPEKSVLSFSPNTRSSEQLFFQELLNMPIQPCHEQYLGLPSFSGRDKSQLFSGITDKIWKLMNAWREQLFSIGGKEQLMSRFWWGKSANGNAIHWKNWKFLCKAKIHGGRLNLPTITLPTDSPADAHNATAATGAHSLHLSAAISPEPLPHAYVPHTQVPPTKPKWLAPPSGRLKLNTDAAVNVNTGVFGLAAILRDSNGDVLAAMVKPMKGCVKTEEMEALAVAWSLKLLLTLRLSVDFVETDSLMVVNGLKSQSKGLSAFYVILNDITFLLSNFPRAQISHVYRSANNEAHLLAKFALTVDSNCTWLEEVPPPLMTVM
uniref:Reverse transcriptase domain-containing protein n=1 Tax=Cannabis sativa TaxID=3483 RepID=A0A803Q5N4_CANSA